MSAKRRAPPWLPAAIVAMALAALVTARFRQRDAVKTDLRPAAVTKATPPAATKTETSYRLAGTIDSGLKELRGIAIDADDNLYLAGDDTVKTVSADGRLLREWAPSQAPTAIAVSDEGEVYVAERAKIEVFDSAGKLLRAWGEQGRQPGELGFVTGIALHGADVFAADAGNRCIHRFDTTGDFINDLGRRDPEQGVDGIVCPSPFIDLAIDEGGVLVVTNPGRGRVEQYQKDGTLLRVWGEAGMLPEQFFGCCNPTNLALLPNGRVITAEKIRPRVKVYDVEGRMLAYIGPEHFTEKARGLDVATDSAARIFVADPGSGRVSIFALEQGSSEDSVLQ